MYLGWAVRDVGIPEPSKGCWPGGMLRRAPLRHRTGASTQAGSCSRRATAEVPGSQTAESTPAHPSPITVPRLEDRKRRQGERKNPVVKTSQSLAGKLSPRKM